MTVPNPFIEFAVDPVGALAWVGYALLLVGIVLMALWWSLRKLGTLAVQYRKNSHTDAWWSGPFDIGIVPPPQWTASLSAVIFVWAVTAWAISALFWLIG